MAHCDFVGIGEAEGDGEVGGGEVFFDTVDFTADILAGSADERQEFSIHSPGQYCHLFLIHGVIIHYNHCTA